jgi:putative CocE/NonD family hydrolase
MKSILVILTLSILLSTTGAGFAAITEKNVMVPTRDGVLLATDIYRPETKEKLPVLVARTPYNKDRMAGQIDSFVKAGYVVAIQDVRGRFASEGDFYPYIYEVDDAFDFYEWLQRQDWCDGNIGTFGPSYLGGTQLLPARNSPQGVKAMIPEITFDDQFANCIYQGGAKVMHDLVWTVGSIIPDMARRKGIEIELPTPDEALEMLPIAGHPTIKEWAAFYHEWLEHSTQSDYWRALSPSSGYEGMMAPALNISGWYDIFVPSTINNFTGMKERAGSEAARNNVRLIMGPWSHMDSSGHFPELSYGDEASDEAINLTQIKIDWYDKWVKGLDKPNGPPVKIFVMGANIWRDEVDWPLPDTQYRSYYLRGNGLANTADGDGWLSTELPADEPHDSFIYDPMNPVPTIGGQIILPGGNSAGPRDQREAGMREDVLVYTTPVFDKPMEVTGNIELKLFASSDSLDTDFTAKLVDVFPDGRAMLLTDGILRARFRESFEVTKLLEPGEVYEFTIDLGATSNVFLPGHRLRLDISSSNFPKYNRNSNTGGDIAREKAEEYKPANNRVYHDSLRLSRLILPIIER